MGKLKFLVIILISIFLTQCSSVNFNTQTKAPTVITASQQAAVWQANKVQLNNLKTQNKWNLTARVGITSKEQSASSQLDWSNNNNKYHIRLRNALTFGEVKVDNTLNKVKLTYDNKDHFADNPEELLFKLTKVQLPISELHYWIMGLPSPNYNVTSFALNQYAVLDKLVQAGFHITYADYLLVNNKYILPHRIIIKSPGLYIKISVANWDL